MKPWKSATYNLLTCLLGIFISSAIHAQDIDTRRASETTNFSASDTKSISCLERLRIAERLFENGQYQAMIDTLAASDCLNKPQKSEQRKGPGLLGNRLEKLDQAKAHRLLSMTYLHLEGESEAAKANMEAFLKKAAAYIVRVKEDIDPYDFAYLYAKYRTTPIAYWSFAAGLNYSFADIMKKRGIYGVGFVGAQTKDIKRTFGLEPASFFLQLDVAIPLSLQWRIGVGLRYVNTRYKFRGRFSTMPERAKGATTIKNQDFELRYTEVQDRVELPFFINYQFQQDKFSEADWFPYLYIGGSMDYILEARYSPIERREPGVVTPILRSDGMLIQSLGSPLDIKENSPSELRNVLSASAFVGFGFRRKLSTAYITFDLRFRKGLTNLVNTKNRYANQELVFNFGQVDHDFRLDDINLSIGYTFSTYRPKEKSRKWRESAEFDDWVIQVIEAPWDKKSELSTYQPKARNTKNKKSSKSKRKF